MLQIGVPISIGDSCLQKSSILYIEHRNNSDLNVATILLKE